MAAFSKFNALLVPLGGRYFIDEDGVRHKAENWEFLALRVANYRKRAGKPAGNPTAEIIAQVCARQPEYCREDPKPPVAKPRAPRTGDERGSFGKLTERVLKWVAHVVGMKGRGEIRLVSRAEATRRALVCAHCPLNRGLNQSCGSCNRTRNSAAEAVVGKRVNAQLGGCKAFAQDNSIAVHLDLPTENAPGKPSHCWR